MPRYEMSLPHPVRVIENVWITLADGCRLAARIWRPDGETAAPVPAILEYIPYRKRDFMRRRDEGMHHWCGPFWAVHSKVSGRPGHSGHNL